VGQKTHPLGFRLGTSQSHNSTWFSDFKTYDSVLEADYKIREIFTAE
jgi:small subunit ribosomal protein S3